MNKKLITLLFALTLLITACTPNPGSATAMLPNIPTADIVEGKTITQFISSLPGGDLLASKFPQLYSVVQYVEQVGTCYSKLGAVAMRTYSDKQTPLSSGTVLIIDRNALTDPANLAACLTKRPSALSAATIQPCAKTYTLKKDNNEFYIAFIASTQEMCTAICSGLEGCSLP